MEENYIELWDNYYPKVFGYFYRRLNNHQDVEDLCSVTLASFFACLKKGNVQNYNALLWKIAHNQLVSFIRSKSKNPISIDLSLSENQFDTQVENGRSDNYKYKLEHLQECIKNQLTDSQQEIVHKSIIEDKKSYEVALEIGITADNVRQILSRSIKKLKAKCKELWLSLN
jgi:RNA polymerase sigma-70 factor, ECF subfamily